MSRITVCVIAFCLMYTRNVFAEDLDAPIVTLPDGKIQGHVLETLSNRLYYAYQEIPYASPPIGNLRFKDPQAPERWSDTLNTTRNTVVCFQGGKLDQIPEDVEENEDCLYLNVYTPLRPRESQTTLPVLVWIHGGDFYYGDGTFQSYGPQFLIDHGIVVVTFNYRLGPFGFLTTADETIPANLGLKDQYFVLEWVKKNIYLFGGDSSKVTIAGENTGAVSVGYQLLSQRSKDLFRAAILQSGTSLCATGYQPNATYYAFEMGRTLNPDFSSNKSSELLEILQNASASDINNVNVEIPEGMEVGLGDKALIWLPIIENVNFSGVLITGPMHDDIENGNFNQVPVMLGFNSEEELSFVGDGKDLLEMGSAMDRNFSKFVLNKFNMTEGDKYITGRSVRLIYTSGLFQQNLGAIVRFMSDQAITTPVIRHAELQSQYTNVYLYQFSHKGMLGGLNQIVEGAEVVGQGEDLNYIWNNKKIPDGILPVSDNLTRFRILKLWVNFIKYMNPTPEGDGTLGNIKWPEVTTTNITYLNINRTLEIKTNPREYQRVKDIIDRYALPPLVTY